MMRRIAAIALAGWVGLCGGLRAEEEERPGITVEPADAALEPGREFQVFFPDPMVGLDELGAVSARKVLDIEPATPVEVVWRSQTQATLRFLGPLKPGTSYRVSVAEEARTAEGLAPSDADWETEWASAEFVVRRADWGESRRLDRSGRMALRTNYPVRFAELAGCVRYREVVGEKSVAAQVLVHGEGEEGMSFTVETREPLEAGREWELVVEGLKDAATGTALRAAAVLPAGETRWLRVKWLGAFNLPLGKPEIVAEFDRELDPESVRADRVKVEPQPPGFRVVASGRQIKIEGAFDRSRRHVVTLDPGLLGADGFGLEKPERWGATFRKRECNVMFPGRREFHCPTGRPLRFPVVQINTPPLAWRLAAVPLQKLSAVRQRLDEFREGAQDPLTGEPLMDEARGVQAGKRTELFVEGFGLEVVARGELPATSGDEEVDRTIEWTPDRPMRGAYLLEADYRRDDGAVAGNRALVFFGHRIVTEVADRLHYAVRVLDMETGEPVAGANVSALSPEGVVLGRAVTDQSGLGRFPDPQKLFDSRRRDGRYGNARMLVVEDQTGTVLEPVDVGGYSAGREESPDLSAAAVTDRNVYRPGQAVKLYGIVREREYDGADALGLPEGKKITWMIGREDEGDEVARGEADLTAAGGWEAEWAIPESVPLGTYQITVAMAETGNPTYWTGAMFQVQEYRPPLFTNSVTAEKTLPGESSRVGVASRYFHGAPNAGAKVRWRAVWRVIDRGEQWGEEEYDGGYEGEEAEDARPAEERPARFVRDDQWSEKAPDLPDFAEQEGEAVLGADGSAELVSRAPFQPGAPVGRCRVEWKLEIISPDGQALNEVAEQIVQLPAVYPGLVVSERTGEGGAEKRLAVEWMAFAHDDAPVPGAKGTLEIYALSTKTAKEQVAPFTFRYRNWPVYEKIAERALEAGPGLNQLEIPVEKAGDYILRLRASSGGKERVISDRETVSGRETAEFPVEDERRFALEADEERAFKPGEIARFTARAPFAGRAWVYVHTQRILDVFPAVFDGNAGAVEIPVKPEYAPNVGITVHLVAPAGGGRTPMERVARARMRVARPDRELSVAQELARGEVEPGQSVEVSVRVTGGGKPVAGAELAVFAVDEAVLSLGAWEAPDLPGFFFPERYCDLSIGLGLSRYVEDFWGRDAFQKGYVVGAGGLGIKGMSPKYARKEFKPLAYWKALAKTDGEGRFRYAFPAPDNLTTYRIVAVAQDGGERFAVGETKVAVSKPLIVEPALPRFVREGDAFDVRAVTRHKAPGTLGLQVTYSSEAGGVKEAGENRVEAPAGEAVVVNFRASVPKGAPELAVTVGSAAEDGSLSPDAAEVRLPVHPATVLRRETVMRSDKGAAFEPGKLLPEKWRGAEGRADVILSSSPWIAKLEGLPAVLEYPHGCFEQTATRFLACSFLAELLAYLPEEAGRRASYEGVLRRGMKAWRESLLPGGFLPMWPGGKEASPFVTVMAAWAVEEAARAKWEVPEELAVGLGEGLDAVARDTVRGRATPPSLRAFALMVLALRGEEGASYEAVADDLYLGRDRMDDEGRAFLAFALSRFGILKNRLPRLYAELDGPVKERAFDPETFASTTRAEAVRTLAFAENEKGFWKTPEAKPMRDRLLHLLDSSESLSTQENLWLLFAFRSLHRTEKHGSLKAEGLAPRPGAVSKNGASAGWFGLGMGELEKFSAKGLAAKIERTVLLRAEYRREEAETARDHRGFRVERVATNLTDKTRVGTAERPFKLGDKILITYRLQTPGLHHFVALEDMLPAGLETVNPDLALFAKTFELPDTGDAAVLELSHKELRDDATRLYFDEIRPGTGVYSVLARATVAGVFAWPATQVAPMYDSRFGGLSASQRLHVVE